MYNYILATGVIVPDTGDILTTVQTEFTDALGTALVLTPNTPQGVLINLLTGGQVAVVNNNAAIANQINPNLSGGIFLDAICALTGLQRTAATFSIATVNLAGVPGTVIPIGSTVVNANQEVFISTGAVTLSGGGTGSIAFQAQNSGPIAAPANTLTTIVNGVVGWETATNPSDAILGANVQSDAALRLERKQTLALQGNSLAAAILSAVYDVPNVNSAIFRENVADTTQVINGVTMVANSIYLCVSGGTDLAVATAILSAKSGGCDYNNGPGINISQAVVEPASGQTYTVLFDRPNPIPVLSRITITQASAIVDPDASVIQAVLDYANGVLEGEPGFTVGTAVSCFELGGAVLQEVPNLYVVNSETSLASPINYSNAPIPIAIFEQATINSSSITVVLV